MSCLKDYETSGEEIWSVCDKDEKAREPGHDIESDRQAREDPN